MGQSTINLKLQNHVPPNVFSQMMSGRALIAVAVKQINKKESVFLMSLDFMVQRKLQGQ